MKNPHNSTRLLLAACLVLLGATLAYPQKAELDAKNIDSAKLAKLPGATLRDPFWPVGYGGPRPATIDSTDDGPRIPPPSWPPLRVRSTSKIGPSYMVIIQGVRGWVEAGNIVRITKGHYTYRWKIDNITEKGLEFTQLEALPIGSKPNK